METIRKEIYELPVFEDQLLEFTYSPAKDYTDWSREDPETHDGELHIKETVADSGKETLSVVHRIEDEDVARYRFDIRDRDQRICRYTGEDTPPWSIFCAVTDYGYRCETAPKPARKHIFGLLFAASTELFQRVQDGEYEYSIGVGSLISQLLLFYVQVAAVEEQIGPGRMEEFVSSLPESNSRGPIKHESIESVLSEMGIEDSYFPASLLHPSVDSLTDTQTGDTKSKEESDESQEDSSVSENLTYVTVQHRGRGEHENKIYASIIGSDAIDWFSFEVTDEENNKCVVQSGLEDDLPPYIVIDSVRKEFQIENIPSFAYDDDTRLSDILLDVDQLVRRTTSQFPPESFATENLINEYLHVLDVYLPVVGAYEFAPKQYDLGIERIFSKLNIRLTAQNVIDLGHTQRHKISAAAFQAVKNVEEIRHRERGLHNVTRIEERRSINDEAHPSASLLKKVYDPGTDLNN